MSSASRQFDFIIAGAGCAGLSLAARIASSEILSTKSVLVIDKEIKDNNDRTWCFWEKENGFFEPIVHKSWDYLDFHGPSSSRRLAINPYRYKMIRSADLYRYAREILVKHENVKLLRGDIESLANEGGGVRVRVDGNDYQGRFGFNSTLAETNIDRAKHILIKQHFRGWVINTRERAFDPAVATLMDFRVSQSHGTAFFYLLPVSENRALVEYTVFSQQLLDPGQYTKSLTEYIYQHMTQQPFTIEEEEQGVIPMTNYPFPYSNGNIYNIGTAGGQTKGSTGYTFQFIQKHSTRIVDALVRTGSPPGTPGIASKRFSIYDAVLLRVLSDGKFSGAELFTRIFNKGNPLSVLRFLDNESNLMEDIAIMNRMPKGVFGAAGVKELLKGF